MKVNIQKEIVKNHSEVEVIDYVVEHLKSLQKLESIRDNDITLDILILIELSKKKSGGKAPTVL